MWVILPCTLVLGLLVGWGITKCRRCGVALVAAAGGVYCGDLLVTIATIHGAVPYWIIVVGMGLLAGIAAWRLQDPVIMLTTAWLGSWAFVRGISVFAGGFPTAMSVKADLNPKGKTGADALKEVASDPRFYGYLAGIVVLFCLSLWYQCHMHNKQKKKEQEAADAKESLIFQHGKDEEEQAASV